MAKSDADATAETGVNSGSAPPRRINVAVTPDMMAAIDRVIEREGVSLTEAVRRLIGYGDVVYRAVRERDEDLLLRAADGKERQIMLV